MKKSPFRPCAVLLPGAFAFSSVFGYTADATNVFLIYSLILLIFLAAPGVFRNASCAEPGIRRVDARFIGSAIHMLIAALLTVVAAKLIGFGEEFGSVTVMTAVSLMFEQLFEERLYAIGRQMDANLLSLITTVLFTAGVFLGYSLYGAAAALVISICITAANQPVRFRKPIFSFSYIPRAVMQDLVPTVLLAASIKYLSVDPVSAFVGWMIFRGCRSFARCSPDETCRPLFSLSIVLLISSLIPFAVSGILPAAVIGFSALISAAIGFDMNVHTILSMLLFGATGLLTHLGFIPYAAITAFISCLTAFDRHLLLRKV